MFVTADSPTEEQLIETMRSAEFVLPPGEAHHYSNFAFALLGRLVTQAAKVTSIRRGGVPPRGYLRSQLQPVWRRLGIAPRNNPTNLTNLTNPATNQSQPPGSPTSPTSPGSKGHPLNPTPTATACATTALRRPPALRRMPHHLRPRDGGVRRMSGAVRFERHDDQYVLRFAYDPSLVALVKTVPAYARSWRPTGKVWLVDRFYAEQLARDMAALGYLVTGLESQKHESDDTADWARILLRRVGPTRVEPVFRSLTRVLHPDNAKTGDTQLQRELNAARAELTTNERNSAA